MNNTKAAPRWTWRFMRRARLFLEPRSTVSSVVWCFSASSVVAALAVSSVVWLFCVSSAVAQTADDLTHLLQEYVRIDTSNPPGDTRKAADFVAGILEREGIAVTRYE